MWEELESYRNHFLQSTFKEFSRPSLLNRQQEKEWSEFMKKRDCCKNYPQRCTKKSTYFEDRAELAYGWFALPKLMHEMDSDSSLTHWRAIVSLSEFLLNPLHAQRAILEKDIVRKVKNAFVRKRLKQHKEQFHELDIYLKIYNILSRNLDGAERIVSFKCLMLEFYKMLMSLDSHKEELVSEILRNLTGKPKVLSIVLSDPDNLASTAAVFKRDPCRPIYPTHLWHHLCHMLEVSPERGIALGLFDFLHKRIENRLPKYWDLNAKAFALLLRCEEGQNRFDQIDGVKLIYEILTELDDKKKRPKKLSMQLIENYEFIVLTLMNGLHSKRALWRCREFTTLPCYLGRLMSTETNPRLQFYCLKTLRELGVMPCIKRYIIGNWLKEIRELFCLDAESECARDELLTWLRRDVADSSS